MADTEKTQSSINEPAPVPPRVKKIGTYELIRLLGRGGMGEVWLARDTVLQRNVALKLLPTAMLASPVAAKRFLREARTAAQLNHPNGVTIYQVGEQAGQFYIAMELVEGGNLAEIVARCGALPWLEATRAIRDAATGLAAAHESGLVHRDIKPSNLMRTSQGFVKVVDFGLAKAISGSVEMTHSGLVLGTPAYMAPEQGQGQPVDARSDIYSLACTYYTLVTGQKPFQGDTSTAVIYQHVHKPCPDPCTVVPELPIMVSQIIAKGMAKSPADRYQSAAEMIGDLDELLSDPDASSPLRELARAVNTIRADTLLRKAAIPPKTKAMAAGIAVALLMVGAMLAWYDGQRSQSPAPEIKPPPAVATNPPATRSTTPHSPAFITVVPNPPIPKAVQVPNTEPSTNPTQIVLYQTVFKPANFRPGNLVGQDGWATTAPTATTQAVVSQPQPEEFVPRRLTDFVDVLVPKVWVYDDFTSGKKTEFSDGRNILYGMGKPCWGDSGDQFNNFICETVARVSGDKHLGWGISLTKDFNVDTPQALSRGVEVLLDSAGFLSIVPSRFERPSPDRMAPIGPLRVASYRNGANELNSLAIIFRDSAKLEVFVNGIEACKPIILPCVLEPAQLKLASAGGASAGSRLEFMRFTVRAVVTDTVVPGWTVLFRSSDPAIWNTDSNQGFDSYAVPVDKAPPGVQFLKMAIPGGKAVIVPMTNSALGKNGPIGKGIWCWSGSGEQKLKAYHLGIGDRDIPVRGADIDKNKAVITMLADGAGWSAYGWGFGHRAWANDVQGYGWAGEVIPSTVFEIAVKTSPLTEDETEDLLPAMVATPIAKPAPDQPTYPLWNGKESVADYAKRAGIKDVRASLPVKMVLIPAGKFVMGSPETENGRTRNEVQHEVTISKPFYIGVYDVTVDQYTLFEKDIGQLHDAPNFKQTGEDPVVNVSWNDAQKFCRWLSKKAGKTIRLPTEAQWEYACRAGTITAYNTGDGEAKFTDAGWYSRNSDNRTHPVGQKKPNAWGLYDMHGNVWQWCSDYYNEEYPDGAATDPMGPEKGSSRVLRGGCWYNFPDLCRAAYRNKFDPGTRRHGDGFRLVAAVDDRE